MRSKTEKRRKRRTLSQKVTISSITHAGILGTAVLLIGMFLFMYSILYDSYGDTVNIARTVSDVLQTTADVPGLVDAVLAQERDDPHFEDRMEASNPADTEGQLLNYRWYKEENPSLAKRDDYQQAMDIILSFGKNNTQLNGTSLMVFDKKTHIASLLCDVEKFGGKEDGKRHAVPSEAVDEPGLFQGKGEAPIRAVEADQSRTRGRGRQGQYDPAAVQHRGPEAGIYSGTTGTGKKSHVRQTGETLQI